MPCDDHDGVVSVCTAHQIKCYYCKHPLQLYNSLKYLCLLYKAVIVRLPYCKHDFQLYDSHSNNVYICFTSHELRLPKTDVLCHAPLHLIQTH